MDTSDKIMIDVEGEETTLTDEFIASLEQEARMAVEAGVQAGIGGSLQLTEKQVSLM